MLGNDLVVMLRVVDVVLDFNMKPVLPCVYNPKARVGFLWMREGKRKVDGKRGPPTTNSRFYFPF